MTATNKARVWAILPTYEDAMRARIALDIRRVSPVMHASDSWGTAKVEFRVPKDLTVQEAIVLMARVIPPNVEIMVL